MTGVFILFFTPRTWISSPLCTGLSGCCFCGLPLKFLRLYGFQVWTVWWVWGPFDCPVGLSPGWASTSPCHPCHPCHVLLLPLNHNQRPCASHSSSCIQSNLITSGNDLRWRALGCTYVRPHQHIKIVQMTFRSAWVYSAKDCVQPQIIFIKMSDI